MVFEEWLAECRSLIAAIFGLDDATVTKLIIGDGEGGYRATFDRGMTPRQCVDSEMIYWDA
jgi:hypothetical protein